LPKDDKGAKSLRCRSPGIQSEASVQLSLILRGIFSTFHPVRFSKPVHACCMRTLPTLLLISTLALQCPAVALADTIAPAATPPPTASPMPPTTKKDHSMTWILVGSAVVLGVLLLTDHAPGGCYNPNDDNTLLTPIDDARPRRPAIGLAMRFPIP
jgi:hypothetical protein